MFRLETVWSVVCGLCGVGSRKPSVHAITRLTIYKLRPVRFKTPPAHKHTGPTFATPAPIKIQYI